MNFINYSNGLYYGGGDVAMNKAFEGTNKHSMLVTKNNQYGYLASAYVMISESAGNPVALSCIDISMENVGDSIRSFVFVILFIVASILGVAIIVYGRFISKTVIITLQKL